MSGLTGTVPQSVLCNSRMIQLVINNNPNLSPSIIPECFSQPKLDLYVFSIYNSSFVETLPRLPFAPNLQAINVGYNQLEGTISEIFADDGYNYSNPGCVSFTAYLDDDDEDVHLENFNKHNTTKYVTDCYSYQGVKLVPNIILLQSNNFYQQDIGPILKEWMENQNVLHISIADNLHIHGQIYLQYRPITHTRILFMI